MTRVLVLNAGSSSLKYRVVDLDAPDRGVSGLIERIGLPGSPVHDHAAAVTKALTEHRIGEIDAVGHRVVHGGTRFREPTVIDDEVEHAIQQLEPLAPLHNPPGLAGIHGARAALPDVPHVAVFDTAFHATLPDHAAAYAIDREVAAEHGIRRFGFHGTSYRYVSKAAARFLGRPLEQLRQIVLHLGNGASVTAIDGGRSIDTSMGLTPLEGLVMGTRSGDIDAGVVFQLARAGVDVADIDALLNRRSGLLGLSGSADLRDVVAAAARGETEATLALEVYLHRIRRYLGAYAVELGGVDAIVFTAGVGENSALIRGRAVERLGFLGVELDAGANESGERGIRRISTPSSAIELLVVPTDEEREIAQQTAEAAVR